MRRMNHTLRIMGIILCFSFMLYSLFFTHSAFAHVLQTDGTIGGVLHIDPNDDPVAGEVSSFFFDLKDTANKFTLSDCICKIALTSGKKTVYETTLSTDPFFTYTFPDPGVYTLTLQGTSANQQFQPFTLSYVIRVEKGTTASESSSSGGGSTFLTVLSYVLPLLVVVVIVVAFRLRGRKRTSRTEQNSQGMDPEEHLPKEVRK